MQAPFNHEQLDVGLYLGNLSVYAAGRLITRLEWHLKIATLLGADPAVWFPDGALYELLTLKKPNADLGEDLQILSQRMGVDFCRHRDSAKQVVVGLVSLFKQWPVEEGLALARHGGRLLAPLVSMRNFEEIAEVANGFNQDYQRNCLYLRTESGCDHSDTASDSSRRQSYCDKLVERYVAKELTRAADDLKGWLNDEQQHLFILGQDIEKLLCPSDVHCRLSPRSRSQYLNGVEYRDTKRLDRIGQWLVASESREPCELYPESSWPAQLQADLSRLGGVPEDLEASLKELSKRLGARSLSSIDVERCVDAIHQWLYSTYYKQPVPPRPTRPMGPVEPIHGIYGEVLSVAGCRATLKHKNKTVDFTNSHWITMARLLIASKGNSCSKEELYTPNSREDNSANPAIYTAVNRFKKAVLLRVGLTMTASGEGYRLDEVSTRGKNQRKAAKPMKKRRK